MMSEDDQRYIPTRITLSLFEAQLLNMQGAGADDSRQSPSPTPSPAQPSPTTSPTPSPTPSPTTLLSWLQVLVSIMQSYAMTNHIAIIAIISAALLSWLQVLMSSDTTCLAAMRRGDALWALCTTHGPTLARQAPELYLL